ncbi:MAG: AEC family transporter [Lachnospiraceae bacterium]|nr:AEC family transporter [Lachnospiraceae bacterium]
MNIGIVVNNLIVIFAMIVVGLIMGKRGMLSDRVERDLTSILMNAGLPCMIFSSMIQEYDSGLVRDSVIIFALDIVIILGGVVLNMTASRLLRVRQSRRGVWVLAATLSNGGFMGFPIVYALLGSEGLFLASMMNLAQTIFCYSLGVGILTRGSSERGKTDWRKVLFTNVNLAVALGLACFLTQAPVPELVLTVTDYFGGITTPLSMLLIGLSLSHGSLSAVFRDLDVIAITGMRLLVMPLLIVLLLDFLPLPAGSLVASVTTIVQAMPCPAVVLTLSNQYGTDSELAARAIFLSSFCCIITIPVILVLV